MSYLVSDQWCQKVFFKNFDERRGQPNGLDGALDNVSKQLWQSYGVQVMISTADITSPDGCLELLKRAKQLGPVGGVFNLAAVLRDNILENQDAKKFAEVMAPKATSTRYLDEASQRLCPNLKQFVVFSSVSCGRGNAGQTNYGMANSIMERIIEHRHARGLPAKAIQWGAVGEVGLVAEMQEDQLDMEISGTLQQRISSCLQELDPLLSTPDPIVASMVVAEKRVRGLKGGIVETVMNIMNIRDLKTLSLDTKLSELGMDSLMAVEIKQTLEREFELFLSAQDLRSLTFLKLQELAESRSGSQENQNVKLRFAKDDTPTGMEMLLRNFGDETSCEVNLLRVQSNNNNERFNTAVLLVPGIEGVAGNAWQEIADLLTLPSFVLQIHNHADKTSISAIVDALAEEVFENVFKKAEYFYLVGYSFGSLIAVELARRLEERGLVGHVLLIDGAPQFLKKLGDDQIAQNGDYTDKSIQDALALGIVRASYGEENLDSIRKIPTWDGKIEKLIEMGRSHNMYTPEYTRKMAHALFNRVKICMGIDEGEIKPLKSDITLLRPTEVSVVEIDEDYGLSAYTEGQFNLKFIEGNHITILNSDKLPQIINEMDPFLKSEKSFICYMHD